MKSGGGKAKGSSFEREICKKLSLWVSEGRRDDLFWRSAMSGGRATVRSKVGKATINQLGDITAIDPLGFPLTDKFVIECKNYANLEWSSFIYGKGFVWKTWEILFKLSLDNNKRPFLILKQNMQKPLVLFGHTTKGKLIDLFGLFPNLETRFMTFYYLDNILQLTNAKLFLQV
jgi:hypothetical protein